MKTHWPFLVSVAVVVGACHASEPEPEPMPEPAPAQTEQTAPVPQPAGFAMIEPILKDNCVLCHTGPEAQEQLDLNSYASLMKGGEHGAVVIPGDPENSLVVKAIRGAKGTDKMPPAPNEPLTDAQIQVIVDWIKDGAKES